MFLGDCDSSTRFDLSVIREDYIPELGNLLCTEEPHYEPDHKDGEEIEQAIKGLPLELRKILKARYVSHPYASQNQLAHHLRISIKRFETDLQNAKKDSKISSTREPKVITMRVCSRCNQKKSTKGGIFQIYNLGMNERFVCENVPIVIATKTAKCLPVLLSSIDQYVPEDVVVFVSGSDLRLPRHKTINVQNIGDNFGIHTTILSD